MNEAIGWERALIGTVLYDPSLFDRVGFVHPSDLTGCHQAIWSQVVSLASLETLDLRSVIENLRTRGELAALSSFETDAKGEAYIAELLSYRGEDIAHYANQVLAFSGKRQLGTIAALIKAEADDRRMTYDEALSKAEERIFTLRRNKGGDEGVHISELLSQFETRSQNMRVGKIEVWEPEIVALRRMVKFVDDDDFIVVAARPGMGKSSLIRWELAQSAMEGIPSDIFNLENGPLEYAKWLVAMKTGIDSDLLRDPRLLSEDQLREVLEATKLLSSLPLTIITLGAPKVSQIVSISSGRITREGTKRIAVDYIQLVSNGLEKRVEDVSMTSTNLRGIPMRYHVPLMAASQMSRDIARRGEDAEPELTDLRDSGSIEQDATMVWFPMNYWRNPTERDMMKFSENVENGRLRSQIKAIPQRVKIAKNRNGGTGRTEPILWVKSTNVFRTLTEISA